MAIHVDVLLELHKRRLQRDMKDTVNDLDKMGNEAAEAFANSFENAAPKVRKSLNRVMDSTVEVVRKTQELERAEKARNAVAEKTVKLDSDISKTKSRLNDIMEDELQLTDATTKALQRANEAAERAREAQDALTKRRSKDRKAIRKQQDDQNVWRELHDETTESVRLLDLEMKQLSLNGEKVSKKMRQQFLDLKDAASAEQKEIADGERELQRIRSEAAARIVDYEKRAEDAKRASAEASQNLSDLERQSAETRGDLESATRDLESAERDLIKAKEDSVKADDDYIRRSDDMDKATRNRIETLRSMREELIAVRDAEDGRPGRVGRAGRRAGRGVLSGARVFGNMLSEIPGIPSFPSLGGGGGGGGGMPSGGGGRGGGGGGAVNVGSLIGYGVIMAEMVGAAANLGKAVVTASQALWLLPAGASAAGLGIGTLAIATHGFFETLGDMGDAEKFAEGLAKLSPNAQQGALAIQALVDGPLGDLKARVQDTFFEGFSENMFRLSDTWAAPLEGMFTGIAASMRNNFNGIVDQLLKPDTMAAIQNTFNNVGTFFENLEPVGASLTQAFADIASVGSDFLPGLADGIAEAAANFADFIRAKSESGELKQWIEDGIEAAKELGSAIWEVGRFIYDTFAVDDVDEFSAGLAHAVDIFKLLMTVVEANGTLINTLVNTIADIPEAMQTAVNAIITLMNGAKNAIVSGLSWPLQKVVDGLNLLPGVDIPQINFFPMAPGDIPMIPDGTFGDWSSPTNDGAGGPGGAFGPQGAPDNRIQGSDGKFYNPVAPGTQGAVPIPGKNEWGMPDNSGSVSSNSLGRLHETIPTPGDSTFPGQIPVPGAPDDRSDSERKKAFLDSLNPADFMPDLGSFAPSSSGLGYLSGSTFDWDAVAQAESSGRWDDNNSGGHSTSSGAPRGGLQITDGTWNAFGGGEFAPNAAMASREQQIAVAERIAFNGYNGTAPQGLGAWEAVTKGMVPGITANSGPGMPTAGFAPSSGGGAYGLAPGTDIRQGASGFPPWVYQVAQAFGLQASTYAGHQEDKGQGNQGIDWWGPVENQQRFAEYLLANKGMPGLEDVIWQNPNTGEKIGVNNGRQVGVPGSADPGYFRNDFADHTDHVHTTQSAPIGGGNQPPLVWGNGGEPYAQNGYGYYDVDPKKIRDANDRVNREAIDVRDAKMEIAWLESEGADALTLQKAREKAHEEEVQLRNAQEALAEAQQGTWKKLSKSAGGFANDMQQIGAKIDDDFGISKGLPGIFENLFKVIANFAAAPVIGALTGVTQSLGTAGPGSGLLGMLAPRDNGLLGPQPNIFGQMPAPTGAEQPQAPPTGPFGIPLPYTTAPSAPLPFAPTAGVGTPLPTPGVIPPGAPAPGSASSPGLGNFGTGPATAAPAASPGWFPSYGTPHGTAAGPIPAQRGQGFPTPLTPGASPISLQTGFASTESRGIEPGQGIPASEGIGIGGGLIGAAQSMGGVMGGGGAAMSAGAQVGIDLMNRTIGLGGQLAGNAVQGLMDTFLPVESELADPSRGWFGRILGAVAGVKPAGQNVAGGLTEKLLGEKDENGENAPPLTPQQVAAQDAARAKEAAGKGGRGDITNNIQVQQVGDTNQETGSEVAYYASRASGMNQ